MYVYIYIYIYIIGYSIVLTSQFSRIY